MLGYENAVGRQPTIMLFPDLPTNGAQNTSFPHPVVSHENTTTTGQNRSVLAAVFVAGLTISVAPLQASSLSLPSLKNSASSAIPGRTSNSTPSNSADLFTREHLYRKLQATIRGLSALDEDDPYFTDEHTVSSSLEFLAFLSDFRVPAPRIFPHGGDALIFEWESYSSTRYVTYDSYIARLKDHGVHVEYGDPLYLDMRDEQQASVLVQALGGQRWRVKQSNSII
ncbi:hypothetical protein [Methylobacterium sp. 77]|uniref:hypothetical protein n=1 Tax=Methylobacterium sp. 77 TaxID=1101192 RepID=UPI0012DCEE41|nr:hypothetical protein [Methylobacterium sp. 77]